jgi:hypothetical protein
VFLRRELVPALQGRPYAALRERRNAVKRLILLSVGLLLVLAVVLPGGLTVSRGAAAEEEAETEEGVELEDDEDEEEDEEVEQFDRNVRLDFKMVPSDEKDRGAFIIAASPEFEMNVLYRSKQGSIGFNVSGEVLPREDGRIFVRYEAAVAMKGDEGEAEYVAYSSVLLVPGKKLQASRMGDKTLVITASYLDEGKKKKD